MSNAEDISRSLGDDLASFAGGPALPAHFYCHVPFCREKCAYCDFASFAGASPDTVFAVFSGLESEVRRWAMSALPGVVETLYVGGGTPSLHAPQVASLIERAREDLPLRADAEITVEANPDSLTPTALKALWEAGANRISVGVQSFDNGALQLLGRCHTARQAREACELVGGSGAQLSVDLICGIPGQTPASWETTLELAVASGAQHVSVYPLSIEEGTPLDVAIGAGIVEAPDSDVAADMLETAEAFLGEAGLVRYEVANYARPGRESRHNTAYWTGRPYAGIGPAAHGMLDAQTAHAVGILPHSAPESARVRYSEPALLEGWLTGAPEVLELLTAEEAAREDVMLGLRLVQGVPVSMVEAAGLGNVLASLARDGLVERFAEDGAERWRTTKRGWLLGNEVFRRVWLGKE